MDPSGVLVSSVSGVLDDSLSLLGFGGVGGTNERISDLGAKTTLGCSAI